MARDGKPTERKKMKTLDEVIRALKMCTLTGYCSDSYRDCPYLGNNKCGTVEIKIDALYYLEQCHGYIENKMKDDISELINKQDIKKTIVNNINEVKKRKKSSSTDIEPKWIPVTESLPKNDNEVLTTYIIDGNIKKRYVETGSYHQDCWTSVWDEFMVMGTKKKVLAWMPLPKPYMGE